MLPHGLLNGTLLAENSGVDLTVPIDARLEALAREWINSRDGETRNRGAEALLYFRTDENVAALKGLLDDPYTLGYTEYDGNRVVKRERVYRVRKAARNILEAWGHKVESVITHEPVPLTQDPI